MIRISLLLLAACTLLGCDDTSDQEPPTPSPAVETDPAAEGAPEPADDEPATADMPAEEPPTGSGLTVTRLGGSENAPATAGREETTATASVEGDAVLLSLTNFTFYCSPPPSFAANMEGAVVVVRAEQPTSPVTRCIGPHSASLRIEGIPAGEHAVSVRDLQGDEVVTAQATVAGG